MNPTPKSSPSPSPSAKPQASPSATVSPYPPEMAGSDATSKESWALQQLIAVANILKSPYQTMDKLQDHARKVMAELESLKAK